MLRGYRNTRVCEQRGPRSLRDSEVDSEVEPVSDHVYESDVITITPLRHAHMKGNLTII